MAPKNQRFVDIAVELDRETLRRLREMPELRAYGLDAAFESFVRETLAEGDFPFRSEIRVVPEGPMPDPADDLPPAGLKVANAKWNG
ncbi:hypothetical protein [Sutterella megalosphaeroides]|uniref:Uncharacterized protein n=1 Tax=Sutterella megalosphaeroides TaxID=2494234 RepID=A0A2Z6IA00_9BURK|nr:hypothetical protein [Sutterella megalosphaeroides]BBF23343.1 hypothetical protein SUTMEG_12340 [Sutterella megalosphaeroides]